MIAMLLLALAGNPLPTDTVPTSAGPLVLTFVGHGTLALEWKGKVVHVDPWGKLADYAGKPPADLVLVTHEHADHLDPAAVLALTGKATRVVASAAAAEKLPGATVLGNGGELEVSGVTVRAVPAYNLIHKRETGEPFHPRGRGNGYVLGFADVRVYVAGDTENVPEMAALGEVDVAFLPMNLPYTMTPEMVAAAARVIQPRILYPYHYGDTDPQALVKLLAGEKSIEVRVRPMR